MKKELCLVSFNLRCLFLGDGINSFLHRAGMILHKIDEKRPDVICFQEATGEIVPFLKKHLPEYELHFRGRNADLGGEGLCAALNKSTAQLFDADIFWLSPTPFVPGSRFENQSDCPCICQSLSVRLDGGVVFRLYHTHLDHISDEARILGIRQVMDRVSRDREKGEDPLFILGDFNAHPDSSTIAFCDHFDEVKIRDLTRETGGTFHDFGRSPEPEKIDYIYTDLATAACPHQVELWKDTDSGIYLSDHYPVELRIALGERA